MLAGNLYKSNLSQDCIARKVCCLCVSQFHCAPRQCSYSSPTHTQQTILHAVLWRPSSLKVVPILRTLSILRSGAVWQEL